MSLLSFFKKRKSTVEKICKKNLYKSTYMGLAFTKNKRYKISEEDKDFLYFIDNTGAEFSVCKTRMFGFYFVDDYFV